MRRWVDRLILLLASFAAKDFNKLNYFNKLIIKDIVVPDEESESLFDNLLKTDAAGLKPKSEKFDQNVFERRRKIMQRGCQARIQS